jgi:hypothetical protein
MKSSIFQGILLATAILCWGHTLVFAKTDSLGYSVFGLIESLPFSFWIALTICIFLFAVNMYRPNRSLFWCVCSLLLLLSLVYVTPCIIEANPRFPDTYLHMGNARIIVSEGIARNDQILYSSYFPGYFILTAVFVMITGISPFVVMKYYPPFLMMMISVLIYLLAYQITRSKRYSFLAPFSFLSFAWFGEFHVCPQSLGIILYLLIVYLLFETNKTKRAYGVPLCLAMVGLVVSHPTSSLFLLSFLALLAIVKGSKKNRIAFLFFLAISAIWGVFETGILGDVASNLYDHIAHGFSLEAVFSILFAHGSTSLTSAQVVINNLRLGQILTFWVAFGAIAISTALRPGSRLRIPRYLTIWVISCFLVLIVILIGSYGLFERVGLFSLVPIAVAFSYVFQRCLPLKYVKMILIAMIAISCVVLPLALYGNESYEYVPKADVSSESFIVNNARNASIVGYWPTMVYWHVEMNENGLSCVDIRNSQNGEILVITSLYRNLFVNRIGNYSLERQIQDISNETNMGRIYDNDLSIDFIHILWKR